MEFRLDPLRILYAGRNVSFQLVNRIFIVVVLAVDYGDVLIKKKFNFLFTYLLFQIMHINYPKLTFLLRVDNIPYM
jgi:hypothetical protein